MPINTTDAEHEHSLPPLLPCPPPEIRANLTADVWSSCMQGWETLAHAYLSLPKEVFLISVDFVTPFILSYMDNLNRDFKDDNYVRLVHAQSIRRDTFLLLHRIFDESPNPPEEFLQWRFLGDVCRAYRSSLALQDILSMAWTNHERQIETSILNFKKDLAKDLDQRRFSSIDQENLSLRVIPFLHESPQAGRVVVIGSDFLDTIADVYISLSGILQKNILVLAYLSLKSLTIGEKPNPSLLFDILYGLKTETEKNQRQSLESHSLLSDLVSDTPFLEKIRSNVKGAEAVRATKLIDSLKPFQRPRPTHRRQTVKKKLVKGKDRKTGEDGHSGFNGVHIHRMSLISQVQDLFPDLGSAFVVKCLDEYDNDVEQVTAHLLDGTIPPHLQMADRSENLEAPEQAQVNNLAPSSLAPRATPPTTPPNERRNVFDNDEFDRLAINTSRLHIGRKNASATADMLLADRSQHGTNKAAIMSALAAFDADDDERDDTYDLEDVGGTVDSARPGDTDHDDDVVEQTEAALFRAFTSMPDMFGRDAATRRSQARQALRRETGLTDEAIEGWAIMVRRDAKRLRRLEAKYATFGGQQRELAKTAWTPAGSGTEDSEASGAEGARGGGFRGRGRSRGGFGRGGNVAGPSVEKGTQAERQRKEANKGGRANHNRRDQRAKKMARGGFSG